MDVAVVGAGGDIGRQIATQLVEEGLTTAYDRLQLVEAPNSAGLNVALGLRSDLADAFGETLPQVDVGAGPDDLVADVVIFAAGATVPCDPAAVRTREDLGEANAPVFESYAAALEKDGTGGEIVIVVSNPVELGVAIFARHVERHRVIGMGSFLDTIRFRNEIARSLAVRRQRVRGLVIGEHGPAHAAAVEHGIGPGNGRGVGRAEARGADGGARGGPGGGAPQRRPAGGGG